MNAVTMISLLTLLLNSLVLVYAIVMNRRATRFVKEQELRLAQLARFSL